MIVEDTSLEIRVPKKSDEISSVSEDMTTVLIFFCHIKCYLTNDGFTLFGKLLLFLIRFWIKMPATFFSINISSKKHVEE